MHKSSRSSTEEMEENTTQKIQLKGGEEEEEDDDDEWVPPVLHSVETPSAIQSQNCKLLLLYT